MTGLPDPVPVPQVRQSWPRAAGPGPLVRGGPRIWPLAVFALTAALVIPGAGRLVLALVPLVVVPWLAACPAGIYSPARLRRHIRHRQSGDGPSWHPGR